MADIQFDDKSVRAFPEIQDLDERLLRQAVTRILQERSEPERAGLTILVTDDETLRQLNNTYLGEDRPTDVLAFPSGEYDPEQDVTYLGDVVLSYPRAVAQARAASHTVLDEVRLLVIHGTLHLLGFDHGDPQAKAEMWAVQESILADLGISVTIRE